MVERVHYPGVCGNIGGGVDGSLFDDTANMAVAIHFAGESVAPVGKKLVSRRLDEIVFVYLLVYIFPGPSTEVPAGSRGGNRAGHEGKLGVTVVLAGSEVRTEVERSGLFDADVARDEDHIDIRIRVPSHRLIVIIENKLTTGEHAGQLSSN